MLRYEQNSSERQVYSTHSVGDQGTVDDVLREGGGGVSPVQHGVRVDVQGL